MKCPTCGKSVPRGQGVCPRCGAMVIHIAVSEGTASAAATNPPPKPQLARWQMHPTPPIFEPDAAAPAKSPQDQQDSPAESSEPVPPRRVPLFRVLVLLAFFLYPFISSFFRSIQFIRTRPASLKLNEAVLCEMVTQGTAVRPKNVYSLRQDPRIFFFSRWAGGNAGHALSLRWIPPRGAARLSPVAVMRSNEGTSGDGFVAWGTMTFQTGMPEGAWKAELIVDREVQATLTFDLRE